ncbi:type III PLP-dependent enzyme [Mesobaculum littorinae]|uniref:ornithine decarboxylase n=1 Tax=Mesobaculum littorinae TaxID=2486419 RepID=A0A438AM05_9RHOB|nr:type III PLP-dependent enzyme [Mesobaculum littorinae]RVV99576.1 type III PLP-dependent enzyme [Mesobaculum littorinae]
MGLSKTIWATPSEYLAKEEPENPVLFFSPATLQATARRFLDGFPGLVTYAVKSNPDEMVIANLVAAGIRGFDVASIFEIDLIRRVAPGAAMHYNNPVRSRGEIAEAVELGVRSFSVDSRSELAKLVELVPAGSEISVRFKLPVAGAAYDFGAKFGATSELATELLAMVAQAGLVPSLTFHPGTQCTDPMAWDAYLRAAAEIAHRADVRIARLNVGGGFPAHRLIDVAPEVETIFDLIDRVTGEAFGEDRPALICEPGRGLVAESFTLATRVRAIRDDAHVFLNDGVYGGLAELPLIGIIDRTEVRDAHGQRRDGAPRGRIVFGPTCDSVDRLPGELALPGDMEEGDFVVFHGMGAYSTATVTRFNGFGVLDIATVMRLTD